MRSFKPIALVGLLMLPSVAVAAPTVERLRGTIERVEDDSITFQTVDGKSETVALAADTKFASVVKSSLDAIKEGVFIGTATKGDNPPIALEVLIFPEAMRGTGEGHYDWDVITDHTAVGGPKVKSAMTNGTVKASSDPMPKVKSAMTNGTVASSAGAAGERMLTVTYKDQSLKIAVPPQAPIVAFEAADRSIMKPGAKAFVVAAQDGGKLSAKRVAVGQNGLTPPM